MVCVYLGPLSCGFSSSLISLKQRDFRAPDGSPDWTDHLILLGGLIASTIFLPLMLRSVRSTSQHSFLISKATQISLWPTQETILHNHINHWLESWPNQNHKKNFLQVGRVKTVASVSLILFFATVMTMVSDNADSTNWMSRLAELSVGFALGLHLPSQQLMIAETAMPHQRYTTNSYSFLFRS